MNHEGHLRFFEVTDCGFYSFGRSDKKVYGGELKETFLAIENWFEGRELKDTTPWAKSIRTKKPQCYCRDIYCDESTNDYVIVLWKADTAMNGNIYGVPETSKGGNGKTVEVSSKKGTEKIIWGMPCYYWVIPDKKIIVSIKFDNSLTDANLFQEYINACMGVRIKNDKRKEHQVTDEGYLRFKFKDEKAPNCLLSYRFHMHQIQTKTSTLSLAKLAQRTKKIIRRTTIKTVANNDKPWWSKIFTSDGIFNKTLNQEQKVEVKVDVDLTTKEVQALLDEASNSTSHDGDNIGFIDDKNTITWADKHILKANIFMQLNSANHIKAVTLYEAIEKKRAQYIKLIDDYQSGIKKDGKSLPQVKKAS